MTCAKRLRIDGKEGVLVLADCAVLYKPRKLALLLLPVIVMLFWVGWTLYWFGDKRRRKNA